MQIAIIGTGQVGGTLGTRWAQNGRRVIFGVRNIQTDRVKTLLNIAGKNASAASVADAIAVCDILALATPWAAAEGIVKNNPALSGKILIDCTNPIAAGLKLALGQSTSGAEQLAEWARGARVVKAFNTTGFENMADPKYGSRKVAMFICGDNNAANATVADLAEELGFDVCVTGPLYHARYLEPLAMLWIDMAMKQGQGRNFGFAIVRR